MSSDRPNSSSPSPSPMDSKGVAVEQYLHDHDQTMTTSGSKSTNHSALKWPFESAELMIDGGIKCNRRDLEFTCYWAAKKNARKTPFQFTSSIFYCHQRYLKEARNSFLGLVVYLLKSKFRIEDKFRFPWYYTTFSTNDQRLFSHWFPSNSCHHSNSNGQPLILNNVENLEN